MQAMGFYATQQEIDDMLNEVKYSRFAEGQGEEVDSISFADLIKRKLSNFLRFIFAVYINHRPYVDVTREDILQALTKAFDREDADYTGQPSDESKLSKEKLKLLLQSYGMYIEKVDFAR